MWIGRVRAKSKKVKAAKRKSAKQQRPKDEEKKRRREEEKRAGCGACHRNLDGPAVKDERADALAACGGLRSLTAPPSRLDALWAIPPTPISQRRVSWIRSKG
jgi:hypothetical protein